MPHLIRVHEQSPFLDEACALCKEPFAVGDELVICPEDGSRHHADCWRANGNHCTAYGCTGAGEIVVGAPARSRPRPSTPQRPRVITMPATSGPRSRSRSKVRALPASNFGCARGCSTFFFLLVVLLCALGCFGLWALGDLIAVDLLGIDYRTPLGGIILPLIS